ncbi:hypothetical protein BNJ_00172 [Kaumoebavirus]|uniref:hypothetical protein n=1 Tax=Kaumoebavirus TaxID=1859492 RepID=UPI0009C3810E|nr:hypothetical protein BNJ_00172 [Kaumoebavirus]ARA72004.1 hypothetical protein BNJ_00172 [Kaumoebavirus]
MRSSRFSKVSGSLTIKFTEMVPIVCVTSISFISAHKKLIKTPQQQTHTNQTMYPFDYTPIVFIGLHDYKKVDADLSAAISEYNSFIYTTLTRRYRESAGRVVNSYAWDKFSRELQDLSQTLVSGCKYYMFDHNRLTIEMIIKINTPILKEAFDIIPCDREFFQAFLSHLFDKSEHHNLQRPAFLTDIAPLIVQIPEKFFEPLSYIEIPADPTAEIRNMVDQNAINQGLIDLSLEAVKYRENASYYKELSILKTMHKVFGRISSKTSNFQDFLESVRRYLDISAVFKDEYEYAVEQKSKGNYAIAHQCRMAFFEAMEKVPGLIRKEVLARLNG